MILSSWSPKPRIMVIVSLIIDLVTYSLRVPLGGETLSASSFQFGLGGKGANKAVACAKFSRSKPLPNSRTVDVAMVRVVRNDAYGTMIEEWTCWLWRRYRAHRGAQRHQDCHHRRGEYRRKPYPAVSRSQ
jgi:hypothetical protein